MADRLRQLLAARVATLLLTIALIAGLANGAIAALPSVKAVPGEPFALLGSYDLKSLGYQKEEFFLTGTATSYKATGPLGINGNWTAVPAGAAPYATRTLVVRPSDPKKFNGTVVVEWLNVTAGTDASPDWNAAHREILRGGYAWVGVSAQKVGVEGGQSLGGAGVPLKKVQPQRYGTLSHPGDPFSFDIYSQAGAVIRAAKTTGVLGPLAPKRILSIGESQSAVFLTTYVNAIDPLAKVYDCFLIHSRFGAAVPVDVQSLFTSRTGPARLRTDLRVPVITVVTETDVADGNLLGFHLARQPDNARLRVWEVPGTAHADNYTFFIGQLDAPGVPLEKIAAGYKPTADVLGGKLAKPMNTAPQHHYVVEAALSSLDRWVRTGKAPSSATPMQMTGTPPHFVLDANGNALGGVRTPWVDVPTARLSGGGNSGAQLAFLVGSAEPYDQATLDRLYPGGKADYLKKFQGALDSAIKNGFILPADRQEILSLAPLMYQGGH
jgi:hypothetical protein